MGRIQYYFKQQSGIEKTNLAVTSSDFMNSIIKQLEKDKGSVRINS